MKDIITELQTLYKNAISIPTSPLINIKKVFFWDPVIIPQSSLPAIAIQPLTTEYVHRWSRYDEKLHTIEVRLIYNAKSYFSETPTWEKVECVADSIDIMEKTDVNRSTENYTIAWIIENDLTIWWTCQNVVLQNVRYSFSAERWFPSYEVVLSLQASVIANR